MNRIKVLVVDDSAFARKVIREVLSQDPELQVVDYARDGLDGLEKIAQLQPDVVTLDLVMPNLDGLGLLKALPREGAPKVVIVSVTDSQSELGLAALEEGAFDIVHKPTAQATDRLYLLGEELRAKVKAAAAASGPRAPPTHAQAAPARAAAARAGSVRLLVIGASTGGPPALTRLMAGLPADLSCAVMVAVHLPAEYTAAFARRLDQVSPLRVREAFDGMVVLPGEVAVARGGLHMRADRTGAEFQTRLDLDPMSAIHRPSIDVLMSSAARAAGAATLGVVLTGMGDDGLIGARAIRAAGGRMLVEAEETCVVYGMPRAVKEAGEWDGEAPLDAMAAAILGRL